MYRKNVLSASIMQWKISQNLVPYEMAVAEMEARVQAIRHDGASEMVWLLEHPALYTAGTSAKASDLIDPDFLPVHASGRGGQYTYHGPGQRVGYVMLDLKKRAVEAGQAVPDVRAYVKSLEQWLIDALAYFGVRGELREGRVGIWVQTPRGEDKIAALGMRISGGVSYHGVSLNVAPDLTHFNGIVPCGLREYGVTSLKKLKIDVSMDEVDGVLQRCFSKIFL